MRPGPELVAIMSHNGVPTAAPVHGLINGTAAAHSPWQSPVPYLFGGLAAMLGLIAFALLILACSYWKLSGYLDAGAEGGRDGDDGAAGGEKGSASGASRPAAGFQEHVVVIMAGDERPTFLAKPAASRAAAKVELCLAAPAASGTAGADGQDKKTADEREVSLTQQLGGDEHADAASQSRGHQDDAAIRTHAHHRHHGDDESGSGTTALQESSQ